MPCNRLVLQQGLVLENLRERREQVRCEGDLIVADDENRPTAAGVFLLEPGEKSPDMVLTGYPVEPLTDREGLWRITP